MDDVENKTQKQNEQTNTHSPLSTPTHTHLKHRDTHPTHARTHPPKHTPRTNDVSENEQNIAGMKTETRKHYASSDKMTVQPGQR